MTTSLNWDISSEMLVEETDEKWDICPEPLNNESFLSWFTRLAKENCSDARLLFQQLRKSSTLRNMNITLIGKYLGSIQRSEKKQKEILTAIQPYLKSNINKFQHPPYLRGKSTDLSDYLNIPLKSPRYCPFCLEKDEKPYFRNSWFFKPFLVCPTHQCLLFNSCPHCNSPIKFWNSSWDEEITYCAECGQNISTGVIGVFKIHNVNYHELLNKTFCECAKFIENADKSHFFHYLWKFIYRESRDPLIKDIVHNDMYLPKENLFRAILIGLRDLENNPKKITLKAPNGDKEIESRFTLENLERTGGKLPKEWDNDVVRRKIKAITPLLRMPSRTYEDVKKQALIIGCAAKTLYNWMRAYREKGIAGLNPQHHKAGRKPKQFPPNFKSELTLSIKEFILNGEDMNIKRFYEKCIEKARRAGLLEGELKYNYFCKLIRQERERF